MPAILGPTVDRARNVGRGSTRITKVTKNALDVRPGSTQRHWERPSVTIVKPASTSISMVLLLALSAHKAHIQGELPKQVLPLVATAPIIHFRQQAVTTLAIAGAIWDIQGRMVCRAPRVLRVNTRM